jgi:hypothetical protein
MQERDPLTELVGDFMERLHLGAISTARPFKITFNRGGITRPTLGKFKRDKDSMRKYTAEFRSILNLSAEYTGEVVFQINQGRVLKTAVA